MRPANYAPVYCAIYPQLSEIARSHGYALAILAILGSLDLICIPWLAKPSGQLIVIRDICSAFAIKQIGKAEKKDHERMVYTLSISNGECFIDLSFMPTLINDIPASPELLEVKS